MLQAFAARCQRNGLCGSVDTALRRLFLLLFPALQVSQSLGLPLRHFTPSPRLLRQTPWMPCTLLYRPSRCRPLPVRHRSLPIPISLILPASCRVRPRRLLLLARLRRALLRTVQSSCNFDRCPTSHPSPSGRQTCSCPLLLQARTLVLCLSGAPACVTKLYRSPLSAIRVASTGWTRPWPALFSPSSGQAHCSVVSTSR